MLNWIVKFLFDHKDESFYFNDEGIKYHVTGSGKIKVKPQDIIDYKIKNGEI